MSFTLHRPRTPEEALLLQKESGGSYLAGGTVTLVNYHRSLEIGGDIISLEAIPGWDSITATETEIQIGPLVTFDRIESSELLHREATALWQAAREVGGPQIRNRATIGGNLCAASPSADAAPPLLALSACVTLLGEYGARTLPLSRFFLGRFCTALRPDELLCGISIPRENRISRFAKVGKRQALAVSAVNMAVSAIRDENGLRRIAISVGAAAPEPRVCYRAIEALGDHPGPEAIAEACREIQSDISPIDDRWATEEYRRAAAANLLAALLDELQKGETP